MKNVLIDSDVILDFLLDRKPFSEDATKIMLLCHNKTMSGFITPVILSNAYYILRKGIEHGKILQSFLDLLKFIDVLNISKQVIFQAIDSNFTDFEDALQNYAAENSSIIDAIITRNVKDYRHSKISIFTPEDFLKTLNVV
jgi:predicted nucleic acid-binding protein